VLGSTMFSDPQSTDEVRPWSICRKCPCRRLTCERCAKECDKLDIGSSPSLPAISPRTCRLLSPTSGVNSKKGKEPAIDTGNLSRISVKNADSATLSKYLETLATRKRVAPKLQKATSGKKKRQSKAPVSNLAQDPFLDQARKTGSVFGISQLEDQLRKSRHKLDSVITSTSKESTGTLPQQQGKKRKSQSSGGQLARGKPVSLGKRLEKALTLKTPIPSGGVVIEASNVSYWTNSVARSTFLTCSDGWIATPVSSKLKEDIDLLMRNEYGSPATSIRPIGTPTATLKLEPLFGEDLQELFTSQDH